MKNKYKKYYKTKLQQELNEASIAQLLGKASGAVKSGLKAIRDRKRGTIRSHVLSAALLAPVAGPGTSTVVPGTPPSSREVMVDPGAPAIPATPGKTIETQKRKVVTSLNPNAKFNVTTQIAGPKTPSTETISGTDLTGKSVRVKLDRGKLPAGTDAVVLGGEHAQLALDRSAPGSVTRKQAQAVLDNPITRDVGGDITSVTVQGRPGSPARPPTFKTEFVPGTPATTKTTPGSLIPQHIEANLEEPTTVQQAPPPNRKRRRGSNTQTPSGEGQVPSGEGRVLRTGGNEDGSRRTGGVDPIPQDTPRPRSVRVPVVTPGRRGLGDPNRTALVPKGSLAARRGRLTNIRENNELQSLNEAIQNILNKK